MYSIRFNFILIFLCSFGLCDLIIAQENNPTDLPQIIPPSPTVAGLMKFEETDVNTYTGQPNIQVPIFQKNSNGFNYNVGLSYNSAGLKMTESSGWTGRGFSMSGTAVISRTVVGLPDEINKPQYYSGIYHNDYFDFFTWNHDTTAQNYYAPDINFDLVNGSDVPYAVTPGTDNYRINEYAYNVQWAKEQEYDYNRDIYQFNVFGRTGRFIILEENGSLVPKIIGDDSNLKLEVTFENQLSFPNTMVGKIDSFKITDENGLQYFFNEIEETTEITVTGSTPQNGGATGFSSRNPPLPEFRSAWFISEVKNSNDRVLASFFYSNVQESPYYQYNYTENYVNPNDNIYLQQLIIANSAGAGSGHVYGCYADVLYSSLLPQESVSIRNSIINTKKIQNVIFKDNTSLEYQTSGVHPEYLNSNSTQTGSGTTLSKVLYKNAQNNSITEWHFTYKQLPKNLLFLDKVEKFNSLINESEDYVFDYVQLYLLENLGEGNYDNFGYHEPNFGNSYHPTEQDNVGVLRSITYPTGGQKVFNWETNTYSYRGDQLLSFQDVFNGNPDNYTVVQDSLTTTNINNEDFIYINIDQQIEVESIFNGTVNCNSTDFCYEYMGILTPIVSDTNQTHDTTRNTVEIISNVSNNPNAESETFVESGWYKLSTTYLNTGNFNIGYWIRQKTLNTGTLNWFLYGGGLRIKSIRDIDADLNVKKSNLFNYDLSSLSPTPIYDPNSSSIHKYSSGSVDGDTSLYREYEKAVRPLNALNGLQIPIRYTTIEHFNSANVELTQGSIIGYKDIVKKNIIPGVTNSNNINSNSIKYEFDNAIDYPQYIPNSEFTTYPFKEPVRKEYLKGTLRSEKIYDSEGKPLNHKIYTYNHDSRNIDMLVAKDLKFAINENDFKIYAFANGDPSHGYLLGYNHPQWERSFYQNFNDYYNMQPTGTGNIPGCGSESVPSTGIPPFYITTEADPTEDFNRDPGRVDIRLTTHYMYLNPIYKHKSHVVKQVNKEYFYNTNGAPEEVITTIDYEFDPNNYQVSKQTTTNSKGDVRRSETVYASGHLPTNWNGSLFTSTESTIISDMQVANRVTSPILQKSFVNNQLSSTVKYNYKQPITNQFVLDEVHTSKGDNPLEFRLKYHRYDEYGNILEVSKKDGTRICYIYGYNKTLPIAKIEGLNYQQVADRLTGGNLSALDAYTDQNLTQINALRDSFTVEDPFMVTTYVYEVGIGITKVTDPRGRNMTYEYDDFNRLKAVRDHEGNILSENEYKYATQN